MIQNIPNLGAERMVLKLGLSNKERIILCAIQNRFLRGLNAPAMK